MPLRGWRLKDHDLAALRNLLLKPADSQEFKLATCVLDGLEWGWDSDFVSAVTIVDERQSGDGVFQTAPVHRAVMLLLGEAFAYHMQLRRITEVEVRCCSSCIPVFIMWC